jgi:hypothetical protein
MYEDFDFSEFRPPDSKMIDYVLSSSTLLKTFSSDPTLDGYQREVLKTTSHTLKVLLAMAIGGYHLYCTEGDHASALADLSTALYDRLALSDPSMMESVDIKVLHDYRTWREEGVDGMEAPLFNISDEE